MKKKNLILTVFTLLLLHILPCCAQDEKPQPQLPTRKLKVGRAVINSEIAIDSRNKEMGLSFRPSLGRMNGMLFVYDNPGKQSYWMYGMKFSLDFIWIRNGKVVQTHENIKPPKTKDEEPQTVTPKYSIDSVLEVNAGVVKKYGIKRGNTVKFL